MKLQTFFFDRKNGWSVPCFPKMDSENTLVLVFFSPVFAEAAQEILRLSSAFPNSHFLGCSTAGEILGACAISEGIVVAVARFERTQLVSSWTRVEPPALSLFSSLEAGKALGADLGRSDLKAILAFTDGVVTLGGEFARGFGLMLNEAVPIAGGLAGDEGRFRQSWVLDKNRVPSTSVAAAVGLYGASVGISQKVALGWSAMGLARQVTCAKANVLLELEKKPAAKVWGDYLSDPGTPVSPTHCYFPFVFTPQSGKGSAVIRTVLSREDVSEGLLLSGEIPADSTGQLLRATPESLTQSTQEMASTLGGQVKNEGSLLCLLMGSFVRRLVLGPYAEEEVGAIAQNPSFRAGLVGFYGYGEIANAETGETGKTGWPELKNSTMTLTILTETI